MRIAIDARYVADHFPGIGRYVYNLLLALARLDQPYMLVVLHNPALPNSRHDIAALDAFPSCSYWSTPMRGPSGRRTGRYPTAAAPPTRGSLSAPYSVRPYAGLPCPSVVTLDDAIPRLFPAEASPRARLLFDLLTRLAIRSSRRVIAISESTRADLATAYHAPPEWFVAHTTGRRPTLPPPASRCDRRRAREYGLPERYILTLSSNKPHKNLPRLVEAFAQIWRPTQPEPGRSQPTADRKNDHLGTFSACQLVIAGHWDPRYPEARELAAQLGLAAAVLFLPSIAEAHLPALLSGAELFAFPSLYEGFGLPPLEALACGAPVLCGDTSSLPEVVGEAALRVDTRSTAALAAGLVRLLNDAALRETLHTAGPLRAAQFSWRRTAEATLAVYLQ